MVARLARSIFVFLTLICRFCMVPESTTRAADFAGAAGEWKFTFPDGSIHIYVIDRHGRMHGTIEGKKVAGHASRQNDQSTKLTFQGSDAVEQLRADGGDGGSLVHFAHKADFPSKNAGPSITGVRQKPAMAWWEPQPNPKISDLAGHWSIPYYVPTLEEKDRRNVEFRGTVRTYSFDKIGEMHGREGNRGLTGRVHIDTEGRMLLTLDGLDQIDQFIPRVDGRMDVQQWSPRSKFPATLSTAVGVATPVTGKSTPGVEVLDVLMLDCLQKIGCSGATLTVARGGHVYYSRGYGWSDFERNVPIDPDTPMQIASCCKPIVAAMVRQIVAQKNIPLNCTVLPLFGVKPAGVVVDKRVWDITIENLIAHKAGWQGEPVEKAWQAWNGHQYPIIVEEILPHVAVQRLAFAPGSKDVYDSFGYGVLSRIIPLLSGHSFADYMRFQLCRPHGVQELKWVRDGGARRKGEPPHLWNGLILEDQLEYRSCVSTPALCTFMRYFWIDGTPRDNGKPLWIHTGGWDNSSTAMIWRPDGINVAWSFNGRADGADPGEALWNDAINRLLSEKKIPSK